MVAVENYMDHCVQTKSGHRGLGALDGARKRRGLSRRYILKCSTREGSDMFQLFDTAEKKDYFVASRGRWLESRGKKATKQES